MSPGRRRLAVPALVIVALTASACSGVGAEEAGQTAGRPTDPSETDADPGGDGANPSDDESGDADTAAGGDEQEEQVDKADDEEPRSVLGQHLGYEIPGLDVGDEGELRRVEQETLVDCMALQGFTYVAYAPDPATLYVPVEEGLDPESREFAAKYGFGVSTQFYAQRDVGAGLLGHAGDGSGYAFEENPNDAIRSQLTPEELEAYERALWGADSPYFLSTAELDELEADGVLVGRAIASHGCIGEAQRAIDGEAGAILDIFAIEILTMTDRAVSDDRYLAYAASVERCVHEAGYDFYANQPPWATLAYFDDLMVEVDRLVGGDPLDELTDEELAALSPREIDALYDVPRDIPEAARGRLGEIQNLEAATAATVWDCGGSADEQRRVIDEILADLQAEFIEANLDELERFRR